MPAPTPSKDWIDVLSALLTPTIAVVGSWIAIQQWRINRIRLKHELFDRKWNQFVAIKEFLATVLTSGKVEEEDRMNLLRGTRGSVFIFDTTISDFVSEIHSHALQLEHLQVIGFTSMFEAQIERSGQTEHERQEILDWLTEQFHSLEDRFAPYLELEERFQWPPKWIAWIFNKIRIKKNPAT